MRTIQTAYCELIIIYPLEFLHFLALRSCHEWLLLHLLPKQRCAATSAPAICGSKQLHCAQKHAEARVRNAFANMCGSSNDECQYTFSLRVETIPLSVQNLRNKSAV